jgi:hypothetical protein
MRADLKGGKTVITLHEVDKREFNRVRDKLAFMRRSINEPRLEAALDRGIQGIDESLLLLRAETPEVDTPADSKAKVKVPA